MHRGRIVPVQSGMRSYGLIAAACLLCLTTGFMIGLWSRPHNGVPNVSPIPLPKPQSEPQALHSTNKWVQTGIPAGSVGGELDVSRNGALDNKGVLVQGLMRGSAVRRESRCDNSCLAAKNGVCDDGSQIINMPACLGLGKSCSRQIKCDLGTDCDDCGRWTGESSATGDKQRGPISWSEANGVMVFGVKTTTQPSFVAIHPDPARDIDVSPLLSKSGMIESGITGIFYTVLKDHCIRADGSRALVIDVGSNFGYFTLYAAKLGCRVVAWEPVPRFRRFIEYGLQLNNLTHLVDLRARVAGVKAGTTKVRAPTLGNWGTAGVAGLMEFAQDSKTEEIEVVVERIDKVVHEDVLMMKVDVEGYEPLVLGGASGLLTQHSVQNIVMEYSPGIGEKSFTRMNGDPSLVLNNPKRLKDLLDQGYTMVQLHDGIAKGTVLSWTTPILPCPAVTLDNLKYDIKDAETLVTTKLLGCPVPQELHGLHGWHRRCNEQEDFHPKSLRSMFPFNTNLWATKDKSIVKVEGVVGLFGTDQDSTASWTSMKKPNIGTNSYSCPHVALSDPLLMVRFRCSCSHATPEYKANCSAEERLVIKALREKRMFAYELP